MFGDRPADDARARARRSTGALDHLHDTMEPWAADGGYFNFAERPCDVDAILPRDTCARLGEVKGRWDPDGMIVANHAVALEPA